MNCVKLKEIEIPGSLSEIPLMAFNECVSLEKVTLSDGLISIGWGAFFNCINLKELKFPNSLKNIRANAFVGCIGLKSLFIPKSVEGIYAAAFEGCKNISKLTISSGTKIIGLWAFKNCTNLIDIELPKSAIDIDSKALDNTKFINNKRKKNPLVIVNGILINASAAKGDVVIPSTVTKIGTGAFSYNKSIATVKFLILLSKLENQPLPHAKTLPKLRYLKVFLPLKDILFLIVTN